MHSAFEECLHEQLYALEDKSWWFRHRNKIIEAGVSNYPPLLNVIVDVGGGNGFVSDGLSRSGVDVLLFEPGMQGIKNARRRGLEHLVCAPLSNSTVNKGSVPSVGLFDVLEHMESDTDFLKVINKALMPRGMLYATVPAHMALWSKEDDTAGYYRRYNLNKFKSILELSGFLVLYATYFFNMLSPPLFVFRTLPYKFGKKHSVSVSNGNTSGFVISSLLEKIISVHFGNEIKKVRDGKSITHGASIFVAAVKKDRSCL